MQRGAGRGKLVGVLSDTLLSRGAGKSGRCQVQAPHEA